MQCRIAGCPARARLDATLPCHKRARGKSQTRFWRGAAMALETACGDRRSAPLRRRDNVGCSHFHIRLAPLDPNGQVQYPEKLWHLFGQVLVVHNAPFAPQSAASKGALEAPRPGHFSFAPYYFFPPPMSATARSSTLANPLRPHSLHKPNSEASG